MKPALSTLRSLCTLVVASAALAACDRDPAPAPTQTSATAAAPAAPDDAAPEAETYDANPPARAPRPVVRIDPQDQVGWTLPATDAISHEGFGGARFGVGPDALREAWSGELSRLGPDEAGGCHYLFPEPRKPESGYGLAFMVEGDRFARIDVNMPGIVAPGGGEVGMSVERIRSMYGQRIEEQPHKYVEGGRYLRVPAESGESAVVFEADADGRIQEWRLGVPPQVDYVEGCS